MTYRHKAIIYFLSAFIALWGFIWWVNWDNL